jgi:WD40 repeat protein
MHVRSRSDSPRPAADRTPVRVSKGTSAQFSATLKPAWFAWGINVPSRLFLTYSRGDFHSTITSWENKDLVMARVATSMLLATLLAVGSNSPPIAAQEKPPANAQLPTDPGEALRKRIMEKVERVKAGVQKQAASGRNPSAIVKTLTKTIKPLLDAGKPIEAEKELDRLLEKLDEDTKSPAPRPLARDNKVRTDPADRFSVWVSKLDGSDRQLILSAPQRQMTHTRVSPDLKWIVFTTYNNPGADGFAKEGGNTYANTEVCLFRLGGTEFKTIAGPVPGEINANASFTSDGKRIIFMSTRSGAGAHLYWYDIETSMTTQVPTPSTLHRLSDPHEVGNRIVFVSHPGEDGELQGIWMMNRDGSEARQISFPKKASSAPSEQIGQGDYDPRLSPDGSRVSILRNVGGAFHVVVVDTDSGKETDLTEPLFPERETTAEGVAAWSSDGKLLIFRHIALPREGPRGVGIYVMNPDGSGRKRIPIPKGEFPHVQPEFFPEGSGPETRVIYQTEKNPRF